MGKKLTLQKSHFFSGHVNSVNILQSIAFVSELFLTQRTARFHSSPHGTVGRQSSIEQVAC